MKQVNNSERQALWETLLLRSTRGKLRHGDRKIVAEQYKISRWVVSRVWKRGIRSMSERVAAVVTSRASQRGRKMMDRAEIRKRIYQTRVADRNNYRTVDEGAGLTPYMIRQLQREGYLRRALTQTPV
ncbi:hypothetical protein F441_09098 [Phytophthora nicotianae CJ01A1]|uniref:DUF7769 domain-containing protein n=1 Tax=Phytophthora nicotianae CJ01A1 TaxID=1317063 RepID=W2X0H7_PHYNI|nr:hypothetical protein F441_09098 [Phytophthora nicotianae CJ01A1]